jgi:hypothetical protein
MLGHLVSNQSHPAHMPWLRPGWFRRLIGFFFKR